MFQADGNLPPGFHDWSTKEIEANLVKDFENTKTRRLLFMGFIALRNQMRLLLRDAEQWLDGSYVTDKIDPADVDIVTIADKTDFDSLSLEDQLRLQGLVSGKTTRNEVMCDSYFVPRVPRCHPHHLELERLRIWWREFFGHDRQGRSKGIVRCWLHEE